MVKYPPQPTPVRPSECRGTGNGSFPVPRIAFPAVCWPDCRLLPDDTDVLCLWALLPLGDLELYDLTLLQIPKPLTGNPGVMDEHILPFLWSDEAIPFLPIEPLDRAFWDLENWQAMKGTASARILPLITRARLCPPRTRRRRKPGWGAAAGGPEAAAGALPAPRGFHSTTASQQRHTAATDTSPSRTGSPA